MYSWLELPDEFAGRSSGSAAASPCRLAHGSVGAAVPLLGPDPAGHAVEEGGDSGTPVVLGDPDSASASGALRSPWPRALDARARPGGTFPGPHPGRSLVVRAQRGAVLGGGTGSAPHWRLTAAPTAPQVASASQGVGLAGSWNGWGTGAITPDWGFSGSSAGSGVGSSSKASRTIRRGSYWRGSNCRQSASPRTRTHLVLQLGPRVGREVADLTDHAGELPRILRQPFRSEHEDADDDEDRPSRSRPASRHLLDLRLVADCRVIVTSVVWPPRWTFILTLSPTFQARIAAVDGRRR